MKVILECGLLLIHKESRLVYSVHRVLNNGNVVLECDDDGSLQNDNNSIGDGTPEEVLKIWEIWEPGMVIRDRTGKGVFCREATSWRNFYGVPAAEIEGKVLSSQPPWLPPRASTLRLHRLRTGSQ